ncbi:helix-turn-helix domain-containing protein [Pelosinus propionicus]|uniref:Helix-turn-helix domain-containing protein n=1 Tax=Pelosinus propionicus DSM 13327 TaxID=1123291 RepID=A0A1I4LIH4_9FIRM|nr:helix-turn-helix transcriptional regulator [Pelosinus propionicus]SFL90908.1 Helix-turn-helix domain-containing protein [Pelosinus propionicus DSM 13327]
MQGKRIRALREMQGITQLELAEKAGIDNSLVSRIENGQSEGSIQSLKKIATVLGVTVAELLNESTASIEKESS